MEPDLYSLAIVKLELARLRLPRILCNGDLEQKGTAAAMIRITRDTTGTPKNTTIMS